MINSGQNRVGLARAIQEAVRAYTKDHAMPPDEIIATMAFCVGSAIGTQQPRQNRRRLMELARKFLGDGEGISSETNAPTSGLIDIRGMVPN